MKKEPKSALIIQNKFIGDVLIASVLANNLKQIFPNIEVDFFCYNPAIGVLENNPNIRNIIGFNDNDLKKNKILLSYAKTIKKNQYDIVIDPYAKLQSKFLTWYSKATYRISFKKSFTWMYNFKYKPLKKRKTNAGRAIDERIQFLYPFAGSDYKFNRKPKIYLTNSEIDEGLNLLKKIGIEQSKSFLLLGVIGSSLDKSLPIEFMSEIIDFLLKNTQDVILFNYVPNQVKDIQILIDKYQSNPRIKLDNPAKNIRQLAQIAYHAKANIANEGGSVHVSKALDIPTFYFFAPYNNKDSWASFEDLKIFESVHLNDYYPENIRGKTKKQLIQESEELYQKLQPELYLEKLNDFLKII